MKLKKNLVPRNHTLHMKEYPETSAAQRKGIENVLPVIFYITTCVFCGNNFRNISMSQGISMPAEGEGATGVALLPNLSRNQDCRMVVWEMGRYSRRAWYHLRSMIRKNRHTVLFQLLSQTEYR